VLCGVCACFVETNDTRSAVPLSYSLVMKKESFGAHEENSSNHHYAFPCDACIMASIRINNSGVKHNIMMLVLC
jgi:hypothetical protein